MEAISYQLSAVGREWVAGSGMQGQKLEVGGRKTEVSREWLRDVECGMRGWKLEIRG